MTAESLAKITFTRGEKIATPSLICASKDGGYYSKSFFAFFFAGDLVNETINVYQEGDKVVIDEGCVLKCAEGSYLVSEKIEYVYLGEQWTTGETDEPETVEYSSTGVPIDGVTNWGKDKGYVGIVIYNEGLTFKGAQTHLQIKPGTKTEKITFSRGTVVEECSLIVAGVDGTKNISYCAYFFGGDLLQTSLQVSDQVNIEVDFVFTFVYKFICRKFICETFIPFCIYFLHTDNIRFIA
jgi:hypothetical protein